MARGTEAAVVAAVERPTEQPRVLVIPQWCVDPPGPNATGAKKGKGEGGEEGEGEGPPPLLLARELPSLALDDLRERRGGGTAGLCHTRGSNPSEAELWFGASASEDDEEDDERGWGRDQGALRGGRTRKLGGGGGEIVDGLALLRSDVVAPVMVVDLWSAPALFLRHVEVS